MRILVTGGAGYIGSHTVRQLLAGGHDVTVYDNLSHGHLAAVPLDLLVVGHLDDVPALDAVLAQRRVEAVIHFAAFAYVGESIKYPAKYYANNLVSSLGLLDACRRAGVQKFVFSSTCATYGVPDAVPIAEDQPQRPINPYGNTKLAFERALADYAGAYPLGYCALRYFNAAGASPDGTIGEDHDPETHLIPLVFQAATGRRPHVEVFGTDYPTPDGTCVRDYVHVDDLALAHILALDRLGPGAQLRYNVGTGRGYSVRDVIRAAEEVSGLRVPVRESPRRAGDPPELVADAGKVRRELGWSPQYPELRAIMETAWNWHKSHPNGYADRRSGERQIRSTRPPLPADTSRRGTVGRRGDAGMSDVRGLLDRISAFRQRLDAAPAVTADPAAVVPAGAFRQSLRRLTGVPGADDALALPPLTARAQQLLHVARGLLDRQRRFAADPLFAGAETEADPLVAYHQETAAVMGSAVRLVQMFPDSPTLQLKLCDGLDGVLGIVRERLGVQDRALGCRRADADRIDRLAGVLATMSQLRPVDLNVLGGLAEELLDEARETKPLRFYHADPLSTRSRTGGPEFPAPARFLAAHALTAAQVVARVVPLDYEWAGRPLVPVAAALLMDVGMMRVPAECLARSGPLTADERRVVEQHPRYGADLVRRYVPDAGPVADAVAAHHERADGTGYGAGLKGTAVPPLGRLLAVADVYAAMCCPRPHRDAHDTRAALTDVLLMADRGQLDRDFAEYLAHLSFYPVGAVVELTDGRVGVVAANQPNRLDPRAPGRPVVAVLAEADGTLLPRAEHLDLSAAGRGGILRTLPAARRLAVLGGRYPDLV